MWPVAGARAGALPRRPGASDPPALPATAATALAPSPACHSPCCVAPRMLRCMSQVLMNLVRSSIKLTQHGSIKISASQTHDAAHVVVADTGDGMSPAQLAAALDPFTAPGGLQVRVRACKCVCVCVCL